MTPARTKQLLRYGITVDLVILATGIGWLFPELPLAALVGIFAVAAALAGLRAAWEGIALAMVLSAASLYFAFHATPLHLAACAIASVILGAIVRLTAGDGHARVLQPATSTGLGDAPANVVSFDSERAAAAAQREQEAAERAAREREEAERIAREREEAARIAREREERERAAAEKLAKEQREREALEQRLAAERAEAERIAREREKLERAAAEKLAKERAESEARIAREREEAERAAAEKLAAEQREREALEQRLAAERAEAERIAREREELERAAAEKLAAEQREREALEQRLAAERAEAERITREREELERATAEKLAAEQREREALEQRLAAERAEAERIAREREELERATAEKLAAEQREREALEQRLATERAEAERIAREREELERATAEKLAAEQREREALEQRLAAERAEAERIAREREELERATAEKLAAEQREREALEQRLAAERADIEARIAREREEAERAAAEKLAAERDLLEQQLREQRAAAENAQRELEERIARERQDLAEREALERLVEQQRAAVTAARDEAESRLTERLADAAREADAQRTREREQLEREMRGELERRLHESAPAAPAKPQSTSVARKPSGVLSAISGWFRKSPAEPSSTSVNLRTKKVAGNTTATRRATAATSSASSTKRGKATRKPRILLLEKRRGTADTVLPKLRYRGIEVQVVERWIDAVDELFRFRPDAFFLDSELPDFDRVYKAVTEHGQNMPLLLTGRHVSSAPAVRFAQFVTRPYDIDELTRLAQEAMNDPSPLLAKQTMPPRTVAKPVETPARIAPPPSIPRPAPAQQSVQPQVVLPNGTATDSEYSVVCFNCRVAFDANDADWCSCLTKERTLVCTNCLMCFCKAAPAYKEKFWVEAPPRLFERKTAELRRQQTELAPNVQPDQVRRPLVLLVEDDEDIQVIVQRVCANLGYGFVGATNGQDGLAIARQYRPNLILSDAFMPKLDGREMCRILKEEATGADCKMVVMTGLYTDTKYKSEALKRFHIDDYLSKPVAITDLINLLQRHLEGVSGLPQQEDLHELHRKAIDEHVDAEEFGGNDVALSDLMDVPESTSDEEPDFPDVDLETAQPMHVASERRATSDSYEVCCFSCNKMFDATRAEWCTCLGRDQTLVCSECGSCFCRAPSIYKERFWVDAPSTLFERKMIGSKRNVAMHGSPDPAELRRPLILLVEDDENIQLIVKTVVTTMGYGFIAGANGQEGLTLAREYNPDLILSDAFMPKLDGREMCRLLKEDPSTARAKAIIMTGLYTDRKYRAEALSYFKVDDYVAKPLAVDDLIKLMKKHLPQDAQPTM